MITQTAQPIAEYLAIDPSILLKLWKSDQSDPTHVWMSDATQKDIQERITPKRHWPDWLGPDPGPPESLTRFWPKIGANTISHLVNVVTGKQMRVCIDNTLALNEFYFGTIRHMAHLLPTP